MTRPGLPYLAKCHESRKGLESASSDSFLVTKKILVSRIIRGCGKTLDTNILSMSFRGRKATVPSVNLFSTFL